MSERVTGGPVRCRVRIGSLTVGLAGDPLPAVLGALDRVRLGLGAHTDAVLDVRTVPVPDWVAGQSGCGPPGYWVTRPGHVITAVPAERRIRLRVLDRSGDETLRYWLQRDLFAALGSLSGEVLLHGSAVIRDGRGYVFCAESGVGKSTVARMLAAHAEVVNDETNWVCLSSGQDPVLVNQPYWFGPAQTRATVPVAAVFLLRRAEPGNPCRRSPVPAAAAFAGLLSVHLPFDARDPFLPARARALVALVTRGCCERLEFRLDPEELEEVAYADDA
jgi:hypothetical protein